MIVLLLALVAMISAWFHPVEPAPIPEPPAVVVTTEPAPEAPETISEAPVEPTEAPAEPTEAPEPAPAPESSPEPVEEPAPAQNWMEELQTTADPNGIANWHFYRNGAWGASDGYNIYIDPNSPVEYHLSIMKHEIGHVMQERYYGNLFDAPDMEQQADCIAQILGATWINYGCPERLVESAHAVIEGS